jgi:hypothetical protein
MKFDPTISLGNVFTVIGAVVTILFILHKTGTALALMTAATNELKNTVKELQNTVKDLQHLIIGIDRRVAILEDRDDR